MHTHIDHHHFDGRKHELFFKAGFIIYIVETSGEIGHDKDYMAINQLIGQDWSTSFPGQEGFTFSIPHKIFNSSTTK